MSFLREEIIALSEYNLKQYPCRIKLNQNENPYELPSVIKEEILQRFAAARWSRYPAFVPQEQIELLAAFTGHRSDGILIGNGSNDLLQLLIFSSLGRGTSVVISQPTFTLYKLLAQSLGATVLEVPMVGPFAFDVDQIIGRANADGAAMVIVCSPNNPTGTCLSEQDVRSIVERTRALVVLDEAYVQFARESRINLLAEYDRLVILQTFSKAMGAAGLRFGYSLSDPALARQLNKVKLPYSVNIFTLIASEVLIRRWGMIEGWIEKIVRERESLLDALRRLDGVRTYQSGANFLLFETLSKSPADIFNALLRKGILIRDVSSYPLLDRGLRVSVGTPEDNKEFLAAMKEVL